ncbi:polymorphic toxin-type HINT domain-containing protein [Rhodopirellula halodulae]|uniref:polymorphic toxin-type HINT domain-containing protein n=1 Tax=Rhodopirellula halodulae TaxID=2894198 RepID=UPI001E32D4CC|nr:polymorphic toxin-type HINT domain-containing protein [Rhodopirellula sp. JC737]MCC9658001.1 hypothetical protein [Rhodopirellula sp. JC737]
MKATRIRIRHFHRALGTLCCAAASVAIFGPLSSVNAAEPTWQQALVEASASGNVELRDRLLSGAAKDETTETLVNSLRGQLLNEAGQWVSIDESIEGNLQSEKLLEYEERRAGVKNTPREHWQMAQWCQAHRLASRARAHAQRTIDLQPNHVEAHRFLGHVQVGNEWVNGAEAAQRQKEIRESQKNLRAYQPRILGIAAKLDSTDERMKERALQQLNGIDSPRAVNAIVQQTVNGSDDFATAALDWLSDHSSPEASLGLARIAVFDSRRGLRSRAARTLKDRDPLTYVPEMLEWCRGSIDAEHRLIFDEGDRSFQVVRRQRREDVGGIKQLDSVTQMVAVPVTATATSPVASRDTVESVHTEAARDAATWKSEADQLNVQNQELQSRILAVVKEIDDQYRGNDAPEELRQWWADYRGYGDTGEPQLERRLVRNVAYRTVGNLAPIGSSPLVRTSGSFRQPEVREVSDSQPQSRTWAQKRAASTPDRATFGVYQRPPADCLVAGTLVWTDRGMKPVESLELGDQVLSCNVDSGKLSYQSVLRRTEREPEPLTKIQLSEESIIASDGHPFWVVGRGWTPTEHLVPGDSLHTASGMAVIETITPASTDKTYNLMIESNHSYFVGKSRVLSHDAEVKRTDDSAIPGLTL